MKRPDMAQQRSLPGVEPTWYPPLPEDEPLREQIGYRDNPRGPTQERSHEGLRTGAYHLGPLAACPLCGPWWQRALAWLHRRRRGWQR